MDDELAEKLSDKAAEAHGMFMAVWARDQEITDESEYWRGRADAIEEVLEMIF